jgi:hypothetical protein
VAWVRGFAFQAAARWCNNMMWYVVIQHVILGGLGPLGRRGLGAGRSAGGAGRWCCVLLLASVPLINHAELVPDDLISCFPVTPNRADDAANLNLASAGRSAADCRQCIYNQQPTSTDVPPLFYACIYFCMGSGNTAPSLHDQELWGTKLGDVERPPLPAPALLCIAPPSPPPRAGRSCPWLGTGRRQGLT